MGFIDNGFRPSSYGGFRRVFGKAVDLNPKISENISASIGISNIDLIPILTTTTIIPAENVSASISVGAALTEVFYFDEYLSENISASIGVTVSLSSV